MTGWIKRQRERRGDLPANVRAELEAEGDRAARGDASRRTSRYRHYDRRRAAADQRCEQNTIARARPHAEAARRSAGRAVPLDATPGPVELARCPEPRPADPRATTPSDTLRDALGRLVEIAPRRRRGAEDIHARLQAWNQPSTS